MPDDIGNIGDAIPFAEGTSRSRGILRGGDHLDRLAAITAANRLATSIRYIAGIMPGQSVEALAVRIKTFAEPLRQLVRSRMAELRELVVKAGGASMVSRDAASLASMNAS